MAGLKTPLPEDASSINVDGALFAAGAELRALSRIKGCGIDLDAHGAVVRAHHRAIDARAS